MSCSVFLFDDVIEKLGLDAAVVFGRIWTFSKSGTVSCFYTDTTIKTELGISKRTSQRILNSLEQSGFIVISLEKTPNGFRRKIVITHSAKLALRGCQNGTRCQNGARGSAKMALGVVPNWHENNRKEYREENRKSVCGASAQDTHENNNSTNQSNEKTITRKDVETTVREYLSKSDCPKKEWNNPESINLITVTIANWIIQKKAQVQDLTLFVENAILNWKGIETALNKSQRPKRSVKQTAGFGSRSSDQIEDDVNQAEEQMKRILSQMNQSSQNDEVITDAEIVDGETPLLSASSNPKQTYYFN